MAGLYIHIPFCKQACSYCDFYFLTRRQLKDPFTEALIHEIRAHRHGPFADQPIRTIYLGGGTPSLLSGGQVQRIFEELHQSFDIQSSEITMELNPDDVTPEYLRALLEAGVNRASMGIQSFQPELLQFMNRAHTSGEAEQALDAIRQTGFPSYTADLIYGNPGQTLQMLEDDIQTLLKYDPPHISAYSLTVEPNTRLGKQVELGRLPPPDDEETAAHFDLILEQLSQAGIDQYEVSNFSKPGKEAEHNSGYWSHENYLGLGPAAHSFWWEGDHARRWKNRADINHYLEHSSKRVQDEEEILSEKTLAEERLMLGLRTARGVTPEELRSRYNYRFTPRQLEFIDRQVRAGTMHFDQHTLRMSRAGLRIADLLTVDLLSGG
jgi:oxygen-independent coproporphyrinogen III oxidase